MSVNDRSVGGAIGVDTYPSISGVANPTSSSDNSNPMANNFVTDPTTEDRGAGAGPNFEGDQQATRNFKQTAGVVEGRPGIIESTNIDPLNQNSNKDDGWANTTQQPGHTARTTEGFVSTATTKVADAANQIGGRASSQYKHDRLRSKEVVKRPWRTRAKRGLQLLP
ncbi:hypothetical protein BT96DRAFT_954829 [Gymnopus androsaceus JB14]|uniref:Uncharacterized protein n=1 Tax=Gymnopus androsaceus JB14 TaxID=1447944 RepID=A0A6A4IB81_9AGAR|nr:hypothetical protein BT96DRAFT_954829 [Gymnopus androsaceus JB14]